MKNYEVNHPFRDSILHESLAAAGVNVLTVRASGVDLVTLFAKTGEVVTDDNADDATVAAVIAATPSAPLPPAPVSAPIDFGSRVSASPVIIKTGLSIITGHWTATWTGTPGHDGGVISSLARGGSITLTGGTTAPLVLTLDNNGNLIVKGVATRDYTVSLNLFGR